MSETTPAAFLGELFSLAGRHAVITGASGGIGRALAIGFARAGARVGLCDVDAAGAEALAAELSDRGLAADAFALDLADAASVRACADALRERFGRVDALVNGAAINRREPILSVDAATFDRIMAVNLRGLFLFTQAIVPLMPDAREGAGGGSIINFGSINSEMALDGVSVYGASKGAVKQLTMAMALEWAPRGLRVNGIIPGFMRTPLSAPVWADPKKKSWMEGRIALRRPGEPDELVGLAIFLASGASSYVTGQSIVADGGVLAGGAGWAA